MPNLQREISSGANDQILRYSYFYRHISYGTRGGLCRHISDTREFVQKL